MPSLPIQDRIRHLLNALNKDLFEKEEQIRLALLSAIAGESIFLLGPPGVAKSMVARRLKFAFAGARAFEYLMGKFSTPDEVFGPVSISKLKDEDKYERLTENYLPGANIVFLDEIWKASPAIQNSLLTVLNEKVYRNGEQEIHVDLRGLIAASNELPMKGEGLEALWDRFLIRLLAKGIAQEAAFNQMITLPNAKKEEDVVEPDVKIQTEEYHRWKEQIDQVEVPEHVLGLLNRIKRNMQQRNATQEDEQVIYISDRRWRKMVHVLRTSAFLNGRNAVHVMDCFLLAHCMWNHQEQIEEIFAMILGSIDSSAYNRILKLSTREKELKEIQKDIHEATRKVTFEKVRQLKVHLDGSDYQFYKIEKFWSKQPVYIFAKDLKKLKEDEETFIQIHEKSGKKFVRFRTHSFKRAGDFQLLSKGNLYDMETEMVEQEVIVAVQPPPEVVQNWNARISHLLAGCEEVLETLRLRKKEDLEAAKDHLFVPANYSQHVKASIDRSIKSMLNLKLEIEKTRHGYATLSKA